MKSVVRFFLFAPMLMMACRGEAMAHPVASPCATGVSNMTRGLEAGYGPGTPFENAVSLAALKGNVPDLTRQFRDARRHNSLGYVSQWLDAALNFAVRANQLEAAMYLLDQGARVNERAMVMMTVDRYTMRKPGSKTKYLSSAGTPLANAVQCVHVRIASLLLNRGADMYAFRTGEHPEFPGDVVYAAVMSDSEPLVDVFLEHGLDPCKVKGNRYTLAQMAVKAGLSPAMQSKLNCRVTLSRPVSGTTGPAQTI